MSDFKLPSSADLLAAMASIESSRSNIPTKEDLYDTNSGAGFTKWRMPNISSVLASNKLSGVPTLLWSIPGDYSKTQKLYRIVNGTAQEVLPTGVVGILIDLELRPSLPSNPGTPSLSVIGVCHQGKCTKRLPNLSTGVFPDIYNYSDRPELRYKEPSKALARLKYKPVTSQGLLEDLIKSGRSTGTIIDKKDNKEKEVAFNNRGMAYMYVTAIKVDTALATDSDGNPVITKVMNKAEVMANLVTTERRVEGKVYRSYTYSQIIPMSDVLNEDGEPIGNKFLAINMSNGAMKGNYKGGYANICKYVSTIQSGKAMKAPLARTLTEDEAKTLHSINERGLYKQPLWWLTVMTLVPKEVRAGTFYSVPHFEGFNPFGSSCYEGMQHETWADAYKGSSLNVSYPSEGVRDKLQYSFSTISECLKLWDAALIEAGFPEKAEEFTLESVTGKVQGSNTYTGTTPPSPLPNADSYYTEADELEPDLYE